jgi:MauM/NapG family ferredoxin protein
MKASIGGVAIGVGSYTLLYRDKEESKFLRPPYAINEKEFISKCVSGCNKECATSCPYEAINIATMFDRVPSGTPYIVPSNDPCRLCIDFPCVNSCPTGALDVDLIGSKPQIGLAKLNEDICIASFGIPCYECVSSCITSSAISFTPDFNTPKIDNNLCTGCGLCEYSCPASLPAIKIFPV